MKTTMAIMVSAILLCSCSTTRTGIQMSAMGDVLYINTDSGRVYVDEWILNK